MPLTARLLLLLPLIAATVAAQKTQSFVPVGDNGSWATVGAILSALSFGTAKLLDKLRR